MKYVLIIIGFLVGCGNDENSTSKPCYAMPDSLKSDYRSWLISCIEKGNPLSDEEPEDLVLQCEKTGIRAFSKLINLDDRTWGVDYYVYTCDNNLTQQPNASRRNRGDDTMTTNQQPKDN